MASYGSILRAPALPRDSPTTAIDIIDSRDAASSDASEQTPLLSVPDHSFFPGSAGVCISTPPLRPRSNSGLLHVTDQQSLLSQLTSGIPLGIEAEAIPATASHPDSNGDFRLPRDENLRYHRDEEAIPDSASKSTEVSFHGGITNRQFWLIFTGILIANFISAFDSTIMASTHTSITSEFHASELASWLSTSFLLTSTSFQPLYGRISDVVGRKIPFLFACTVFTLSTIWCALAQSFFSFVAARAVCGIGAGGMLTMGAIVLSDILPIEVRGSYQSINNLAWGAGSVMGAATGGWLADHVGWRWEFGMQVPFGIFCIGVLYYTIPGPKSSEASSAEALVDRFRDFDFAGSFFLTTSLSFLILGMSAGGNVLEWTDWRVVSCLAVGLLLGNFLLRAEMKALSPVMPLRLLCSTPRGLIVFNNFFTMVAINAILFNIPLYFQAVRDESASMAGTRLLYPSLAGTVTGVSTGFIITKTGKLHPTLYTGAALLFLGTVGYCIMPRSFPSWGYFLFLIPTNLGTGLMMPSALMSMLATSTQADQAVATSTLIMWRSLGGVLGVASSSLIVQNCLSYFLDINVTGPNKKRTINTARGNVRGIRNLDAMHKFQVQNSYEASLRYCFAFTAVIAAIAALLIVKIKLPNIRKRQVDKMNQYSHVGE